jgi:hypothetical protein
MSDYGDEHHEEHVEVVEEHHSDYSHHSGGVDVVVEVHGTPHDDEVVIVVEESHGNRNAGIGVFCCILIIIIALGAVFGTKGGNVRLKQIYNGTPYINSKRSQRAEDIAMNTNFKWRLYTNMRAGDIAFGGSSLYAVHD